MDDQTTGQPEASNAPELSVFEQLCQKLYAYRFGTFSFLELLDAFEEILHIPPHADQSDAA